MLLCERNKAKAKAKAFLCGSGDEMRVIVPLQGVVQGTGGLFWGSVIPCALFYFLQLYFKNRNHHPPPSPPPNSSHELPLPRTLSPRVRGATASSFTSGRVNSIAADSPYYVGLRKVADNPYHRIHNPHGVIQLGLAQNTVSSSSLLSFSQLQLNNCVCDYCSRSGCSYPRT